MIKKLLLSTAITVVLIEGSALSANTNLTVLEQSNQALSAGKVYAAQALLEEAEKNTRHEAGNELVSLALADTLLRSGDVDKAESKLQSVYRTIKERGALASDVQQRLGHIAVARHDSSQAANWYGQAVNSAKQAEDNAQTASALINLASVTENGDLLKKADVYIATLNNPAIKHQLQLSLGYQAVQLGEMKLAHQALQSVLDQSSNRRFKAQALGYQAELYAQQHRTAEALQLIEQALLTDSSTDLHLDWNWKRAQLLATQSKHSEALAVYRQAIHQLQNSRIDIPIVYQNGESSFNKTFSPLYSEYIDLLLQQSNTIEGNEQQQLLEEVLQTWEQLKVVEFKDYFRSSCVVEQHKNSTIEEKTAVLYPMMLSDKMALVVRFSDHIKAYSIQKTPKEVVEQTKNISNAIINGEEKLIIDTYSKTLHQWLIAPISGDLQQQNIETLVYLPDGGLRKIPFALLYDGKQYLTEKYTLVTTPGMSLVATQSDKVNKKDILLAGASDFSHLIETSLVNNIDFLGDDYEKELKLRVDKKMRSINLNLNKSGKTRNIQREEHIKILNEMISPLPAVEKELKELSTLSHIPVLENSNFLLSNFKRKIQEGHSIIHIATHGIFSGDPEKSYVMTFDQLLTMKQLSKLFQNEVTNTQPIELIVFSACQTAKGDDRSPLGLSGVVVQAGVKSAIGSLWSVSDDATAQFFSDFYKYYQQPNTTKAQAMQHAQKDLINGEKYNHPFYWAPFILAGEWH